MPAKRRARTPEQPLREPSAQPPGFGPDARAAACERFRRETFDCLIIGGGITGAGIGRDAALRGYRVALIEKGDFAAGTSSGSSQLVHGGLRYLEHLEFQLVFEALRERARLLSIASPFVRPLGFLFPLYEGSRLSPWKLSVGLWLYDLLSWRRTLDRHRRLDPVRVAEVEPGLRRQGLRALAWYNDACTDDARITLATVRGAAAANAACANYVEATRLVLDGERVVGAEVRDHRTGVSAQIRARVTVNAAGVWAQRVLALAGRPAPHLLRPSKGSHVVFPHGRLPVRQAIIFESPSDRRIMFVIPWDGFTIAGTTETEYSGAPELVSATSEEVDYILRAANMLFPGARLTRNDARGTYAALRPLADEMGEPTGALSREHIILEGPDGLVTIVGGKLTTYRAMAEEMVDLLAERLREPGGPRPPACRTATTPLPGAVPPEGMPALVREVVRRAEELRLGAGAGDRLARRYGADALAVLEIAAESPDLLGPLGPRMPYLRAEAAYAARHEMAISLSDFMFRRTRLALGAGGRHLHAARTAAGTLASELGWEAGEAQSQLERYREDWERCQAGLR